MSEREQVLLRSQEVQQLMGTMVPEMTDAEAAAYIEACREHQDRTGDVPVPHQAGVCVTLVGRECAVCTEFREKVVTGLETLLNKMEDWAAELA